MDVAHDGTQPRGLLIVGQTHCTPLLTDTSNDDRIVQETNPSINAHQLFESADDEQIHVSTSRFECDIAKGDVPPRFETDSENQGSVVLQSSSERRAVAVKVDISESVTGSKEHRVSENKPNQVSSRAFYTSEDMRAVARRTQHGWVNASHRDILFGLFLHSDASDLEDLAKNTRVRLLGKTTAKCKSSRGHAFGSEKQDTSLRSSPLSVLSLVPLALSKSALSLSSCDEARSGIGQNRSDFQRPNLQRLSLSELEAKVIAKFEISSTGQSAIATENPQYAWLFNQIGKELSRPLVPQKTKRFTAMPIQYNECSMSAFAKWAFSSPDTHMRKEDVVGPPGAMGTDFPSSPPMFHFCHICRHWGHFELDCTDLSRSELRTVLDVEATACQGLHGMEGHSDIGKKEYLRSSRPPASLPRGCVFCKSCLPAPTLVCNECASLCHPGCVEAPLERTYLVEWLCPSCETNDKSRELDSVVELEGCEGYVIEQRNLPCYLSVGGTPSKSRGISFNERSWSRVIAILDNKVMTIAPKPAEPSTVASKSVNEKQLLPVGEFCWAKRQHASIGTIGRDEWWPAQVIGIVANDLRQISGDSVEVTPYLVKMLAVSRASRVRATSTLPFLTNFRTVGYRRLSHRKNSKSYVEKRFRIGVQEVIEKMGFKTIHNALTEIDELLKTNQNPEHQMSPPAKRALPLKDQNSEHSTSLSSKRARPDSEVATFKQDGFVIRARISGKSEEMLGATQHESCDLGRGIQNCAKVYSRTKLTGCLVAWLSVDQPDVQMRVGTILAADIEAKMALVSAIPQWETKLRPARSNNGVVLCAYQTTASVWMPMHKLHMISNGPERHYERELSQTFVDEMLEKLSVQSK
ncbi:hypothetical protein MHU86_9169 [Fragilaria crotonensis]|nr:hypothetical protein MHU86_9169 [Fragilaria crotonensis]